MALWPSCQCTQIPLQEIDMIVETREDQGIISPVGLSRMWQVLRGIYIIRAIVRGGPKSDRTFNTPPFQRKLTLGPIYPVKPDS